LSDAAKNFDVLPFQVDHIRSLKHSGSSDLTNLAWSCLPCNSGKGPNVAGYDPQTEELLPLFNPRSDVWSDHFEWEGALLAGKSPCGRATIDVLKINRTERVQLRLVLIEAGLFP